MSIRLTPPFRVVSRLAGRSVGDPDELSLRRLRDVVAGSDTSWPRTRAMALLFESDFPNKHRDYEAVLANERDAPTARYLAALYLGLVNTRASMEILIAHAHIRNERVLAGVMQALGRIGDESALAAIEQVQRTAKGPAASHAAVAASFIAYRLDLPGHDIPVPSATEYAPPLTRDSARISTIRAHAADAEVCLRSLARRPFGIELAESPMYSMRCGRSLWMITFNREFVRPGALAALTARKTCLGLVARRSPSSGLFGVPIVVLTSPAPVANEVDILVLRVEGDLMCAGRARVDGSRAPFVLRPVSRPRAFALQIEGTFADGDLEVTTAMTRPSGNKQAPVEDRRAERSPVSGA